MRTVTSQYKSVFNRPLKGTTLKRVAFKRIAIVLCTLLTLLIGMSAQAQELETVVDRTQITIDETFTLRVRYHGNANGNAPDFSPLNQNFDIISRNQSSQMQAVNGNINQHTDWILTLAPKREGKLLIPPLRLGKKQSKALQVNVSKSAPVTNGGVKDVILETHIDKESAYVQEQITLTYRLMISLSIEKHNISDPVIDGVRIEKIEQPQYTRNIGNKRYTVYDITFALFPEESGTLEIPSLLWVLQSSDIPAGNRFRGFGGRLKTHRLRTDAANIEIKPRPASFPTSATWLPADNLRLQEKWSQPVEKFKVGEPITRTIHITALGLSGEQLPSIFEDLESDDFKAYADQPTIETADNSKKKQGSRIEGAAIVPTRAGELTIPAIKVPWWDVKNDKLQIAEIPARTVTVSAASNAEANSPSGGQAIVPSDIQQNLINNQPQEVITVEKTPIYWPILTTVFALLSMVLAVLLWISVRNPRVVAQAPNKTQSGPSEKQIFEQFIAECQTNNPQAARAKLIAWAKVKWSERHVNSLSDVISFAKDDDLTHALMQLDKSLFAEEEQNWSGTKLIELMQAWRKGEAKQKKNTKPSTLTPLYG